MKKNNINLRQNKLTGVNLTNADTLVALLEQRAEQTPDQLSYRFLKDGQGIGAIDLSYRELREKVCAVATLLQTHHCQGERALILIPQSLDYIVAYFACLYAGVVAVPAYPPRNNRQLERLSKVVTDCKAKFILTLGSIDDRIDFAHKINFRDKTWYN